MQNFKHRLVNLGQKPCQGKIPLELDGFYSPLIGLKTWKTPSLGEVSWHCHVAPTRFQSVELHKCHH